ncbi:hypothetical protein GCM10022243_24040 [Saccharothrix violaceirubra]
MAVDVLPSASADDRELLVRALSLSDDSAMNALWDRHDGMGAITRVATRVGLVATSPPTDPTQWGDVTMSADDVVHLYRYILTGLPADQRDFIVDALGSAPDTAADGFDQGFALMGPDVDAYAKQGWMWYLPADLYLHSAGIVRSRYVVAILSLHSGVPAATAEATLDAVTTALLTPLP